MNNNQKIITLVGGMLGGKDTVAEFIASEFGGVTVSTSEVVRNAITLEGDSIPTRDLTRETAFRLRQQYGGAYLVKQAMAGHQSTPLVVLSGIYAVPEAEYLQSRGSLLVNVTASDEIRIERANKRSRAGEMGNIAHFKRLDDEDRRATLTDQRLDEVIALCDTRIDGNIPIINRNHWLSVSRSLLELVGK
jgi:dephospho-CoA kinase